MKKLILFTILLLSVGIANAQYMYDGSGRQIGKANGNYYYNGSGRQIGKVDGNYIYDLMKIIQQLLELLMII